MRIPDAVFTSSYCADALLAATTALVRRYGDGTRYVGDVIAALGAMSDRGKHAAASHLVVAAARAVSPVPYALWEWCASRVEYLDENACTALFRAAMLADKLTASLASRPDEVARNDDALVALAVLALRQWKPWYDVVVEAADCLHDGGFRYSRAGRRALEKLRSLAA